MTIDETLRKADAVLEIILKYDEQNADISFRKVLDEIIEEWKSQIWIVKKSLLLCWPPPSKQHNIFHQ